MSEISMPRVSVIIPTYNRPDMLRRAVASVLGQTYDNYEIIVIDDNSNCDNLGVIEEFHSPRIRYFKNSMNLGGALSRNVGIEKSTGELIAFLDDDDEFYPRKLELQVAKFIGSPFTNLGLVYCKRICLDAQGRQVWIRNVEVRGDALKAHVKEAITSTSAIMVKKSVLKEVGGFSDLPSSQEYELILRILAKGYMVDYVDEVMLVIHQHESARISTGAGAVERLEKIFAIKEAYHHLLTSEEIRDLKHRECIALFRAAIEEKGRRKAAAYLLQAFKHRFWRTRNFLEIAVWILGFPRSKAIKRIWKGFIDEVSFFGRFFIRL